MRARIQTNPILKIKRKYVFATLGLFLVNDFMDYVVGTHPVLPATDLSLVGVMTIALSLASVIAVLEIAQRQFHRARQMVFNERVFR